MDNYINNRTYDQYYYIDGKYVLISSNDVNTVNFNSDNQYYTINSNYFSNNNNLYNINTNLNTNNIINNNNDYKLNQTKFICLKIIIQIIIRIIMR